MHELVESAPLIEALSVLVAVAIGGLWTAFTFRVLRTREKAKTELLKLQEELSRSAVVSIVLNTNVHRKGGYYYLTVDTEIENLGNRAEFLDFRYEPPLSVHLISFDSSGEAQFCGQELRTKSLNRTGSHWKAIVLRPKAKHSFPFLVRVSRPGFYLVEFRVHLGEAEHAVHTTTPRAPSSAYWFASKYVRVGSVKVEDSQLLNSASEMISDEGSASV